MIYHIKLNKSLSYDLDDTSSSHLTCINLITNQTINPEVKLNDAQVQCYSHPTI